VSQILPNRRVLTYSANPDLVDRLQRGDPLYSWDRNTFYGPFPDNEAGYTKHYSREYARQGDHLKGQLA
jgi:hypothetical protein